MDLGRPAGRPAGPWFLAGRPADREIAGRDKLAMQNDPKTSGANSQKGVYWNRETPQRTGKIKNRLTPLVGRSPIRIQTQVSMQKNSTCQCASSVSPWFTPCWVRPGYASDVCIAVATVSSLHVSLKRKESLHSGESHTGPQEANPSDSRTSSCPCCVDTRESHEH